MKRILVEFYSWKAPENLISLLKERYDRVYFLYFQTGLAPKPKEKRMIGDVVQQILGFRPHFLPIQAMEPSAVLDVLGKLLTSGVSIEIDLTGGNEIFLACAGMFLAEHPAFPISLHQYDIKSGKEVFRYPEKRIPEDHFPHYLSVPQIFSLNGTFPLTSPSHHFTRGPLREEILRLWRAVGRYNKEWNLFCSLPCELQNTKGTHFQKCIGTDARQRASWRIISQQLKLAGILKNGTVHSAHGRCYAEFDLDVAREALLLYEKAGNLLELYTAMAAFDSDRFHDIRVGVTADWNGRRAAPQKPDPRNEIDLVLMRQNLPIIASCKNTYPQNEFLYEIGTIARHYGGPYATAALLTANAASATVRQRAKEMGIVLIENINKKSYDELVQLFETLFST